jgi:hypothetical protein
MKKHIFAILVFATLFTQSYAQTSTTKKNINIGSVANDILTGATGTGTGTGGLNPTNLQMENGMRDALTQCLTNSANQVSLKDGFFRNLAIKILFPQEARQVEAGLRNLGLSSICDQAIVKLNRAAEDASTKAKPIFIDALKKITITDVTNILLGSNNAATTFFKNSTTTPLTSAFSPVVSSSLSKVGATQAWSAVTTRYNRIPLVRPVNTDLGKYVTGKAIDGLFFVIAKEEEKIRANINNRTTPIMRDIFGWVDKQRGR